MWCRLSFCELQPFASLSKPSNPVPELWIVATTRAAPRPVRARAARVPAAHAQDVVVGEWRAASWTTRQTAAMSHVCRLLSSTAGRAAPRRRLRRTKEGQRRPHSLIRRAASDATCDLPPEIRLARRRITANAAPVITWFISNGQRYQACTVEIHTAGAVPSQTPAMGPPAVIAQSLPDDAMLVVLRAVRRKFAASIVPSAPPTTETTEVVVSSLLSFSALFSAEGSVQEQQRQRGAPHFSIFDLSTVG
ncbi:hypothetical protein BCR34DRAFT_314473 [Clohesyomyces aquaticus]|uniref:Uncharacterized protein n=1 Tax=Clohesyomyces aquaticus TaxID=1231657 RepID=A0A1Y1ZP78_9PLEO|nr:hypothetical protein BCR34DRAFT_314473 [Clohesyomyces aquaticus]